MMTEYDYLAIEKKWQKKWEDEKVFEPEVKEGKKKMFITVAWPYPSGAMHVGHARTYTVPDVVARYMRMKGFNVLFPMGWHMTGTPIVGAANRLRNNDINFIKIQKERYGVSDEELERMKDPKIFGLYYARESELGYRKGMKALGLSIDWSRECTSIDPQFSKMIEWQYRKLKGLNLIGKGSHPVKFCPNDNNPVTDHDLLEGEGVGINEFTLIKYDGEGEISGLKFPAATLRPETIYGLTNIWLHPDADYVVAEVKLPNGKIENWVVSKSAASKLSFQDKEIKIISEKKGRDFIGKRVTLNTIGRTLLILPGIFVDPEHTSGVVGSVPAHAPFDFMALQDLKKNEELLKKYFDEKTIDEIKKIEPIKMIEVQGVKSPVEDAIAKYSIKSQNDKEGLEQATNEVYKLEFSKGVMAENTGKYKGKKVSEAKEEVKKELITQGLGDKIYEFTAKPVICRCGSNVVIKVVKDQWFIKYSDANWKDVVREQFKKMRLIPQETIQYYLNTVDWLDDWPCTRYVGLGTRLPWDKEWVIESLSDSTIYMAYYTLARTVNKYKIDPEKLDDEVFDYIFLEKGNSEEISKKKGIRKEIIEELHREFAYWYRLDYRVSANELIPNHLTFMTFHHAALFPEKYRPYGIVSLGLGILEGKRMSSSRGIVFAVSEATKKYGADVTRFYLMYMCEPWVDFNWKGIEAESTKKQIERFWYLANSIIEMNKNKNAKKEMIDNWLLSRLQYHIKEVSDALDNFQTRRALQHAFFLLQQDIRWYQRRGGANAQTLVEVLDNMVRMLAPFMPHICEEIWQGLGREGFVSVAEFPSFDSSKMDRKSEIAEELVESTLKDATEILKVTKIKPKKVVFYSAHRWKCLAYRRAAEFAKKGMLTMSEYMKYAKGENELSKNMKEISKFAPKMIETLNRMSKEELDRFIIEIDEEEVLKNAKEFFATELKCEVEIYSADDGNRYDPEGKAFKAMPMRPAIYIQEEKHEEKR